MPIDDDDKPTVTSAKGSHWRTPGLEGFSKGEASTDSEERPTMVKKKEPQIDAAAWLYCEKGKRKGHLYPLKKLRNEFGRASDCEIVIEDDFASSHHGAVLFEDGVWKVFDFASTNGTKHNGAQLGKSAANPSELADGDKVEIGDTGLVFKCITANLPASTEA